jgi:hypothetical protein
MIRHVVMWRLKDEPAGSKAQNAEAIKAALEPLRGRIPGMRGLQVGVNIVPGEVASDVVLITDHDDLAALDAYRGHPDHLAAAKIVAALVTERRSVDFEV